MPGKSKVISLVKLTPPQLPPVLERTRLFEELDRLREQHRVIWIQGPPGSGKTTLLASYLQARKLRPLWYQVDEGDADPGTWFHYLSLGMKTVAPRYKKPLPSLSPEYLPGISVFTRRFFEQLYGRLKFPNAVVFDNFQEVPNKGIFHELMYSALSTIPEETTVIIVSREHPPENFSRLQAEQQLVILDPGSLQLTLEDTKKFLRLRGERVLQTDQHRQAEILYERTQGWLAGMVLLLGQTEKTGSTLPETETREVAPVVFEYFASQVLQNQNQKKQDFLLKTAFFSSMTASMAEQVTGDPDAKQYLSEVARSQYFTERHVGEEISYQYHPLFQAFLRTRIKEIGKPEEVRALQRQTASVLEQAGKHEEALTLFLEIQVFEKVVGLILTHAPMFFAQGRYLTIEAWLSELPSDVCATKPWLRYWLANCQFLKNPKESMQLFKPLVKEFEQGGDLPGMLLSWCGLIDSIMFSFDQLSRLNVWIDYLLSWFKKGEIFPSLELEARVTFTIFNALTWCRLEDPEVLRWEARGQVLLEQVPDISQRIIVSYQVYNFWTWLGSYAQAQTALLKMEKWSASANVSPLAKILLLNVQSTAAWIGGDGRQSIDAFFQARELIQKHGLLNLVLTLFLQGIAAAILIKDNYYAKSLLEEIRPFSERNHGMHRAFYQFLFAWVSAVQGDYHLAYDYGRRTVDYHITDCNRFLEAIVRWTQVQILIELGKLQDADEHLAWIRTIQMKLTSRTVEYMIAFLEAHLALAQGQLCNAVKAIERALAISRETGLVFPMGCLPQVLTRVCSKALEHGVEVEHARYVIKKVELIPEVPLLVSASWPWPVKVYTLGRFILISEAGAISFGRKIPKAPLALLKLLIASGGHEVSQSYVLDVLWPDADGDAAYRSLKMTLSRLRKLLKREDAILFSGGSLSVNSKVCWVDSLSFRELVKQSEIESKQGNLAKSNGLADRANALHQGEFLPHDDVAWILPVREQLEKLQASLMKQFLKHKKLQVERS